MRWALLCVLSSGCMLGTGPVFAVRDNGKAAIGWDGSVTSFGVVGLQGGGTYGIGAPDLGYFAFRGLVPLTHGFGLGGAAGWAWAEGRSGLIGQLSPQYTPGLTQDDLDSCRGSMVFTLQLGLRGAAGQVEFYLSPQATLLSGGPCL